MCLIKITDVTDKFDITSRTLRYYEEVGILQSVRLPLEKYRFYDEENITRLQQLIILRKLQIPIKDIIKIYENRDMTILVQSFTNRLEAIDNEIETLSDLKVLVNEFLQAMLDNGISHISALPLIYERVELQLLSKSEKKKLTLSRFNEITDRLIKPLELSIVELPQMTILSSKLKKTGKSDVTRLWNVLEDLQIPFGTPGSHSLFEFQTNDDTVIMQKLDSDIHPDCELMTLNFEGGYFAVYGAYVDEDIRELHHRMIKSFDDNLYFEVDYRHDGTLRHETLVEAVISPDSQRERIQLYLPVKKRSVNTSLYEPHQEVTGITAKDILNANPVLQEIHVDFNKITTIYGPHYKVLDNGEAEFICWISARMLNSNVKVKLPFRVDIEFLADSQSEAYGYGSDEGSLWFSHGTNRYTFNADNNAESGLSKHALRFDQPVLGNNFVYPGIGDILPDQYNKLTWLIGEKDFAVIINDEVRYHGVNFPYMNMDLHLQKPESILIGSNGQGKKLFRSITIYQLKLTPKLKIKEGELIMTVKQSNNRLPNIRQIVTLHYGENYWFNGCARYMMECLGEKDYDYWFFAGLTGENFTQVYSHNHFRGDGVLDYRLSEKGNHDFVESIFSQCGYASSFVPLRQILNNREMYVQTLMSYIDKGLPVIFNNYGNNPHQRYSWGVFVGYEDYGKALLYMGGDATEPDRIALEDLLPEDYAPEGAYCNGWLFIGEKKKDVPLKKLYRDRILSLPELLSEGNNNYCFGANAFRAWADSIDKGRFDNMKPEEFDDWGMYKVYVCNLATNSGGCRSFLETAMALNEDFDFLKDVIELYRQTGLLWNDKNGEDLEALGGGFNVSLEALQDKDKRSKITTVIREFALCLDKISEVITNFNNK